MSRQCMAATYIGKLVLRFGGQAHHPGQACTSIRRASRWVTVFDSGFGYSTNRAPMIFQHVRQNLPLLF